MLSNFQILQTNGPRFMRRRARRKTLCTLTRVRPAYRRALGLAAGLGQQARSSVTGPRRQRLPSEAVRPADVLPNSGPASQLGWGDES